MRLVPDEPGVAGKQQGDLMLRLRSAVEAKDAENAALRAGLETVLARLDAALAEAAAEREQRRRLELKVAELERRLGMASTDSGRRARRSGSGRKRRGGRGRNRSGSGGKTAGGAVSPVTRERPAAGP